MSTVTVGSLPITHIYYPHNAPTPIRFAAEELRRYLRASLGVNLTLGEGMAEHGSFFLTTPELTRGAPDVVGSLPDRQHDRCAVAAHNGVIWLVGENPRSVLYAVYDLLREKLGACFFAPGPEHEVVPQAAQLSFGDNEILVRGSAFALRDYGGSLSAELIDFVAKNRLNLIIASDYHDLPLAEIRRRGLLLRGPGHIWSRLLPAESLFAQHPEYFPLQDGERKPNGRTACFSNPEVRRILRENLRAYLCELPDWDIFAFWAEDTHDPYYCSCSDCAQMSLSDWYMLLVNEAAEVLAEELPHARLEFIAYHGTREVPSQKWHLFENGQRMLFNFCGGYTRDIYHPLATGTGGNAEVYGMYCNWLGYLQEIGFQGQRLLMEYYNLCEWPNQGPRGRALLWPLEVIREDTQAYLQDGWDGLSDWFCQERQCFPSPFYVWAWLQFYTDPTTTVEVLKDTFYSSYFGSVGEPVREYMDVLENTMHARTSAENLEQVRALAAKLEAIPEPEDTQVVRRLRTLRIHHEYCVLLKEVFLAFIGGDAAQWNALEQPFRDFFEVRHREELASELVEYPPNWAHTWYDWFANGTRGRLERLVQDDTLH